MRSMHKQGKVYKYQDLIFWAQGGVICIEDTRDGSYQTASRAEFVARILVVRQSIDANRYQYPSERNEDYNFIFNGVAAVKEAKQQGDPFDPAVIEALIRGRRKSWIFNSKGEAIGSSNAISHGSSPDAHLLPPMPKAPEDKPIIKLDDR